MKELSQEEMLDKFTPRRQYEEYGNMIKDAIIIPPADRHFKANAQILSNLERQGLDVDTTANLSTGHMPPFDILKGSMSSANFVNELEASGLPHLLAQGLSAAAGTIYQPLSWAVNNLSGRSEPWNEMITDWYANMEGIRQDPEGYQSVEDISQQWNKDSNQFSRGVMNAAQSQPLSTEEKSGPSGFGATLFK